MMTYKTIFKGRLEFGNSKSYDKVLKMYQHRVENFYKSDVLLIEEDIFDDTTFTLNIPRSITQTTVKTWKNTVSILEYVAQFAVAGGVRGWMVENGKIINITDIEPTSDKGAVQAYIRGSKLLEQDGKETEAMAALSRAIEKFERHANAYERRGLVNLKLKNFDDAIYDFTKSIDLNPNIAAPHLGRAKVSIIKNELKPAIKDLEAAIKKSIPLQPIYWKARRIKSECHINLKEHKEAVFELKLFTKRKFTTDNPNYAWRKAAFLNFGKSLLEIGEYQESVKAFNAALEINEGNEAERDADSYLYRGIARQRVGESGFTKDWAEAAELGSKEATKLLAANA